MKNMKVLLVAIAVMSLPIAFSQRAFSQSAPNVDSTDPNMITEGSSGTMTIYGENLTNPDGSCGYVSWWSDVYGGSPGGGPYGDVGFDNESSSCAPDGTSITVSYNVGYIYIGGEYWDDLGSVIVSTWSGWCLGPDVDVSYPD